MHLTNKQGSVLIFIAFACSLIWWFAANSSSSPSGLVHNKESPRKDGGTTSDEQMLPEAECGWRPETMVGMCSNIQGAQESRRPLLLTAVQCSNACCLDDSCIVWQFRSDTGCLHAGDQRVGMEKDGPSGWCNEGPPVRWQGEGRQVHLPPDQDLACTADGWKPNTYQGQCMNLGDERKSASESAASCRDACCEDAACVTWQWALSLGCYYGDKSCTAKSVPPIELQPFQGRRKLVAGRSYTGVVS